MSTHSTSTNIWNHPASSDSSSFLISNPSSSSSSSISNECLKYFESTEIEYFVRTLISEILTGNPDDPTMYAAQFFRKVRLCQHVVSRDLKFIRESHYNRISFVVCIKNAFSGFLAGDSCLDVSIEPGSSKSGDAEMTIFEFSSFVSLLFQGISIHFVELFAAVLEPSQRHESNISLSTFYISHLLSALYFTVVYENWLNELSAFSEVKNNRKVVELRSILLWIDTPAYHSTRGPDKALFSRLIEELITARQGKGDSEISFKRLKRHMFLDECLQKEIINKLPRAAMWTQHSKSREISREIQDLESVRDISGLTSKTEKTLGISGIVDSLPDSGNSDITASQEE